MGTLVSTSPTTGAEVGRWSTHTAEEIDQAVRGAHAAFVTWRRSPWDRRSALLRAVADALTARREQLAALMTAEMGKPVRAARRSWPTGSWTPRPHAAGSATSRSASCWP